MIDKYGRNKDEQFSGLTDTNKRAILPINDSFQIGDFVLAKVTSASQNTLFCDLIEKMSI